MAKTRAEHLAEYIWAEGTDVMCQVKVEDDDREWFYTAKKMHKGVMHARIIGFDVHHGGSGKKLVPYDKMTFIRK